MLTLSEELLDAVFGHRDCQNTVQIAFFGNQRETVRGEILSCVRQLPVLERIAFKLYYGLIGSSPRNFDVIASGLATTYYHATLLHGSAVEKVAGPIIRRWMHRDE